MSNLGQDVKHNTIAQPKNQSRRLPALDEAKGSSLFTTWQQVSDRIWGPVLYFGLEPQILGDGPALVIHSADE
jgi:hypothetical protein